MGSFVAAVAVRVRVLARLVLPLIWVVAPFPVPSGISNRVSDLRTLGLS